MVWILLVYITLTWLGLANAIMGVIIEQVLETAVNDPEEVNLTKGTRERDRQTHISVAFSNLRQYSTVRRGLFSGIMRSVAEAPTVISSSF